MPIIFRCWILKSRNTRRLTIGFLLACLSTNAIAQFPGGGGMPGGGSEGRKGGMPRPMDKPEPRAAPQAQDPIIAVERELPSLAIDLRLTPEQAGLWAKFLRETRDVAQLSRMRAKRYFSSPDTLKAAAPSAMELFSDMADDDRQRADAMTDLLISLKTLFASLDYNQRALFNRRILQAQREPLGLQ